MNKKLYLLFNHALTPEQIVNAEKSFGIKNRNIIKLPTNLIKLWQNIPPEIDLDISQYLIPLVTYFAQKSKGDYVLVQGDFGAVYYMVNILKQMGLVPVYATTERNIIEEKLSDNKMITKRVFKHVCFRRYI